MNKDTRNSIERATQRARKLLEDDFAAQLEGTFDVLRTGNVAANAGSHLTSRQVFQRDKMVAAIKHKQAAGMRAPDAVADYLRDAAFTTLNRFVALKMLEARELVQECITKGEQSAGYREFCGLAPGVTLLSDSAGYRLYIECLFDELAVDLKVLFNRRDTASVLWPRRACFEELLRTINVPDLAAVWGEDETIGWVYQYYNSNDERKKMRESSAPRNSRELAVRNQFFTPRYVVEFLTDNTLGRLWYEMTRSETVLRERCRYLVRRPKEIFLQEGESAPASTAASGAEETPSQEDLLRAPVHIPHRPLKDPRTIRVLDPACGSMHFGLYAFDLFECIYDEAWDIAHGTDEVLKSAPSFVSYAAQFTDKAAFLREVPRLIVEHNLHGIDIDPRAAQIAGLSIWLRAHRAWQRAGVKTADRPRITRSNIVCAEPMPGEKELLREFVEGAFPAGERPAFAFLLERIFDCMKLAGEAGSLLRIEEEIRSAIAEARTLAQRQSAPRQSTLFASAEPPEQQELNLRGLNTDEQFWEKAEARIYEALQNYAEQAENGGFQRRLFAEDAAQGFAFIDLCRKRYDVVVMNPPFGLSSGKAEPYLQDAYPNGWVDLYACFVWRGIEFACFGRLGAITSRSFISSKKLERLRASQLIPRLEVLADLGKGVMDAANVEACAYTLSSSCVADQIWAVDLASVLDREQRLKSLVGASSSADLHQPRREMLLQLPNARLLYSIPPRVTEMLRTSTCFEPTIGTVRCGLTTFDDVRFLRASWEVLTAEIGIGKRWEPFEKGGEYGNYYGDIHLVIKRLDNGAELAAVNQQINGQTAQSRQASTYYYRPGAYYTDRSQRGFAARALPAGCVIAGNAPAILSESEMSPLFLLGWVNSRLVRSLVEMQAIDKKFYPGFVKALPWSPPSKLLVSAVEASVSELLSVHGRYGVREETAPQFLQPWRTEESEALHQAIERFAQRWREDCARTRILQEELSNRFDELYAIADARAFAEAILERDITYETTFEAPNASEFVGSICSYLAGLVFGRWDIRYATRERSVPAVPDPFAPLPVCPPGMLQGDDGLPLSPEAGRQLHAAGQYPLDVAWDGILVDDPEHPLDLERRVQATLQVLWPERADDLEHEACALLGVPSLREWFRRPAGFFADHLKRYSKSRRQAPIYWPLSTATGSYTVWLYYHRFHKDTFYRCLELVKEKLQHEDARMARLHAEFGGSPDSRQRKSLDAQEVLVGDIRAFYEEVTRIAPLWNPNLNDGVIINCAPLWRLIAHKPWQKAVKSCWDELVAGDYDWAHLAMHLWPERVIPKCAKDRSLAIAHGLEDEFWVQGSNGKWTARNMPTRSADELVRERTSPAVKAALKSLLDAPVAQGGSRGRRRTTNGGIR